MTAAPTHPYEMSIITIVRPALIAGAVVAVALYLRDPQRRQSAWRGALRRTVSVERGTARSPRLLEETIPSPALLIRARRLPRRRRPSLQRRWEVRTVTIDLAATDAGPWVSPYPHRRPIPERRGFSRAPAAAGGNP